MHDATHIMMTLDIAINVWLTDSYLMATKVKRLRNSFKKFYGRYPDLIIGSIRLVKDMMADSFRD